MKIIKHFARILVGLTFVFSGFVKGIDPYGFTYKFTDYFNVMGMEWLIWAAFPLAVLLSFAEFAIGVALLFNLFIRFFSWIALLFMAFFLPLTLWIAVKNPVTDCGCFGDALVISNWETFYKNVVLMALTLIVLLYRKNMPSIGGKKLSALLGAMSVAIYGILVIYSYNHLPVFDFRPYKVGVNIPEAMKIPEGAPQEVYENIFYYQNKKTGEIQKFSEDNYPWQDTANWAFSNIESILVKEGYEPPIHDFTAETEDGEDVLDFFIHDENYVFMLIAYDLHKSSPKSWDKINSLADWSLQHQYSFVGLTSTLLDEAREIAVETGAAYEFFNCDEITLKTIIRSNPGLVVLKGGTIVAKYHFNDIPSPEEFENEFMKEP